MTSRRGARVVVESYMVRYPLGGMLSWTLQYLVGLARLGHDVTFVERAPHEWSCFDPSTARNGTDCTFGTAAVARLFASVGLADRWSFLDARGVYHGLDATAVRRAFAAADVFIVMTFEECWRDEAVDVPCRVMIDGDPVFRQIALEATTDGRARYDVHFTTGLNVGTPASTAPDAEIAWHHTVHPVACDLFDVTPIPSHAAFTTVMNWQSYDLVRHGGRCFGQKDLEFERFIDLPGRVASQLEVALAGAAPLGRLRAHGWRVADGHRATWTFDEFRRYLARSAGEFSVCKHGYVAGRSGWFSDRSAAYLASGRPVVLEDTGFSAHLPCGEGLFAVTSSDEAAAAIAQITSDPARHARAARRLAEEHLDATRVMAAVMKETGW